MKEIIQETIFDSLGIKVVMKKLDKSRITMKVLDAFSAGQVIKHYHYSRSMPPSELNLGFYIDGKLNTVLVFSQGVNCYYKEFIKDKNFTEKNLWELVRLFSFDWAEKNIESYCIGQSIKYIKEKHPNIKFLISYADPFHSHIGVIYQATNWLYTGLSSVLPLYKDKVSGRIIHNRTFNEYAKKYPKLNYKEVAKKLDYEILISPPKHRYVMFVCSKKERKKLMPNLKLKFQIYPKLRGKFQGSETPFFQNGEAGSIPASRIPKNISRKEIKEVLEKNQGLINTEGAIQLLINQKRAEKERKEEDRKEKLTQEWIKKIK